ncbi:phage baseplate assembly protein V [Xenorhabdus japonica]|nr:phage baseplate assembly protein V [Xenorhabdus japonica]
MNTQLTEIMRLLRNIIRIGVVSEVDTTRGMCRVATGDLKTDWIQWLTSRAGNSRTWWAPSAGEQVLLLSIGGELTTAFVLPAIFSNGRPAPSISPQATHIEFPDGAVMEYEPQLGALTVKGIKTAKIEASDSIEMTAMDIKLNAYKEIGLKAGMEIGLKAGNEIKSEAGNKVELKAGNEIGLEAVKEVKLSSENEIKIEAHKLELKGEEGEMHGKIKHSGGTFTSNGITVDSHKHSGVQSGGATSGGPI